MGKWETYQIPTCDLDRLLTFYRRPAEPGERCNCSNPDGDDCGGVAIEVLAPCKECQDSPENCNIFCRECWEQSELSDRTAWDAYRRKHEEKLWDEYHKRVQR